MERKPYEKWRFSLEGILYELRVFGAVTKEDEQYEVLIAKTIQKLPKDVREKVLEKANFIMAGGATGTMFSINLLYDVIQMLASTGELRLDEEDSSVKLSKIERANLKIPFILLNFANMRGMSEDGMMSVVAHEIAHFILGHDMCDIKGGTEREADDLVEKWGFKRTYESISL